MNWVLELLGLVPKKKVPGDGFEAYRQGFKLEDNPFPRHTPDHSIWRDDWLFSAGRFR